MFFKAEISILIINKKPEPMATGFRSNLTKLTIKTTLDLNVSFYISYFHNF